MGTPGIYSITSKVNQKIYVGSSVDTKKRWSVHKSCLRRGTHPNTHLQRHVDKWGLDDLVFEVMEVEPDRTLRLGLEQLLITALYGEGCFNQSFEVVAPFAGRRHTQESILKMKDRRLTPEHKAKIALAMKTKRPLAKSTGGIPKAKSLRVRDRRRAAVSVFTPEHRANLSASHKGHSPTPETRAKGQAQCYNHCILGG